MNKIIKLIITILIMLICVDVFGWLAWQVSGQVPADDNFYLGSITNQIIK